MISGSEVKVRSARKGQTQIGYRRGRMTELTLERRVPTYYG